MTFGVALGGLLRPCGPVVDAPAAERARAALVEALGKPAWLEEAWPALAPVAASSPYLAGLMSRDPERLRRVLDAPAEVRLAAVVDDASGAASAGAAGGSALRRAKAEAHLLIALADLGGVWELDAVTGALTRLADAATASATALAATEAKLCAAETPGEEGPAPGLFVLALGKHGGGELNYSSDIDLAVFYDPARIARASGTEPARATLRFTQALSRLLGERTAEGYVFRTDLRLRPDPSSTPAAVPVDYALGYYESVGQNWERAALIKARPVAGDLPRARAFLQQVQPFIWRRSLDYAAIDDIGSILRQIRSRPGADLGAAAGADLKLGAGGIREIEFFVQTQQLILGGRHPGLRTPATRDALRALEAAGHVSPEDRAALDAALVRLRGWEHRVQMVGDEQTHRLPDAPDARRRVASLSGFADLAGFDAEVEAVRRDVARRCGGLFADAEPLSSPLGPLVFTGVDDDPETLRTLEALGFTGPVRVAAAVRSWHHGRISATRTARGRELFTRVAPRLVAACAATGAPDAAFARFAEFFEGLASGVQVQSLFLGQPALFELVVRVLGLSPRLAAVLARRPAAIDALLDADFFAPLDVHAPAGALTEAVAGASFESAMDGVRRLHRDAAFRIGVQALTGAADAPAAGRAFADLADACVRALAPKALAEVERAAGVLPGEVAVVALGKFGGREMTASSDLDLMTLHHAAPDARSQLKGWAAETVYARFTQRLVTALSAPTGEGGLYAVDLRLRPTGTAGPVAVSLEAFRRYHAEEAQTWEALALTRARVVWASSPEMAATAARAIDSALRRPHDPVGLARDVGEMRELMRRERRARGPWDLKLAPGGLVDVEFAAQHLQLRGAARGGPLVANTGEALSALRAAGAAGALDLEQLQHAWLLQSALQQVLRLATDAVALDPAREPAGLRDLLARAGGVHDFAALEATLMQAQASAHVAYAGLLAPTPTGPPP